MLELAADMPGPAGGARADRGCRRLLAASAGSTTERRRLVLLAYYDGWSREQLAARFEKPVNTIKTWLRRSLIEIRECLGS